MPTILFIQSSFFLRSEWIQVGPVRNPDVNFSLSHASLVDFPPTVFCEVDLVIQSAFVTEAVCKMISADLLMKNHRGEWP